MKAERAFPKFLEEVSLTNLNRVDVALEGDWGATVVTVWTRKDGFLGFSGVTTSHEVLRPSIELCFGDFWVGIHCFKRVEGGYLFDKEFSLSNH